MNPIIIIPSRLQSTRLPEKPLADIAGKPMIVHMVERAMQADAGRVVVATDSDKIAAVVTACGGEAVMTGADCPSGSDRIWQALEQIDPKCAHDIIINLQGDMPTFQPEILTQVLLPLHDKTVDISTLAAPIEHERERNDPAVVKVVFSPHPNPLPEGEGISRRALYFSRALIPSGEGAHYHHVGIYAYRRAALKRFVNLAPSLLELREKLEQLRALEAGMPIGVHIIFEAPIGVDTPDTLAQARRYYETH